ncbi:MAG TPA: galactokinase family protein [Blastocatellia bacterium]|nr:galactokinase family protein [Blastocatellia bacterium]
MYRIKHDALHNLSDTAAFLQTLNQLGQHPRSDVRDLFDCESELTVARAPGRLDVMGGIADYSGSLVLEMPIREATFAALQRNRSPVLRIVSLSPLREIGFEMTLDDFYTNGWPLDYQSARALFQRDSASHWASYVAGVFLALIRERGIKFQGGARVLISSRVPEGKGVSSSAALEVSVMQAVTAAYEIDMTPREAALLCQKAENLVAGAPCGVMDQMTASCGEEGRLLALICQPAEVVESIPIADQITFCGLDSGVRHSVGGAEYGDVRAGAFMGYRMIAEVAGLEITSGDSGTVEIDDPRWRGYLANLSPSEFERDYAAHLPERINGADFLAQFQGTTDPVSRISPEREYAVRIPTSHPIYENSRVKRFGQLMSEASDERHLEFMGELMYQSHASYSACGLGSEATDLLVRLVREAGVASGLYGARITGGGSGGTVAVLCRLDAGDAIMQVANRYAEATGFQPYVFTGSSPGSAAFGVLKLRAST